MVKAAPPAPFVIAKAKLLLEFLIIALDPPAQFCDVDQLSKGDVLGHGGKPIFGRLGFVWRQLDQQSLFGARRTQLGIAMRRSHPLRCETRRKPIGAALAPGNGLPRFRREAESERLGGDRLMLVVAPQQLGWPSAAAATRWQRLNAQRPDRGVGANTCYIAQAQGGDLGSQPGVIAVAGIHQHHAVGPTPLLGPP